MKKPYVCYACRDGHHSLCHSDLDPKKVCTCDKVWHIEITDTEFKKFKGTERIVGPRGDRSAKRPNTCRSEAGIK